MTHLLQRMTRLQSSRKVHDLTICILEWYRRLVTLTFVQLALSTSRQTLNEASNTSVCPFAPGALALRLNGSTISLRLAEF